MPCPYTGRERGIIVDGKRYAIESCTDKNIKGFITKLKKDVECLDSSVDALREKHDIPSDIIVDTGIIAIHNHNQEDDEKITKIVNGLKYIVRGENDISILVMTNKHLNRLATINCFRKANDVEFYYTPEKSLTWSPILTPELLMSDIIPMRYKEKNSDRAYRVGLFYFDDSPEKCINFIFLVLKYYHLESHQEIDVFVTHDANSIDRLKAVVQKEDSEIFKNSTITVKQLDEVKYKS